MVGLSNERDKKLISVRTSDNYVGTRFSKVTLCIRRHERNGENKRIADWAQKIQSHKICAQSEARKQMGSWTGPLKVSSQGLFPPVL